MEVGEREAGGSDGASAPASAEVLGKKLSNGLTPKRSFGVWPTTGRKGSCI